MKGLESYQNLLNLYKDEVKKLEDEYKKVDGTSGVPYRVINSRMSIPKLYLLGPNKDNYYFHDLKESLMPLIIGYFSDLETMTSGKKATHEVGNPKGVYQEYLDDLLKYFYPFPSYVETTVKNERSHQYTLRLPSPPKRKNAVRQIAEYRKDMEEFRQKTETHEWNIRECEEYLAEFNRLCEEKRVSN